VSNNSNIPVEMLKKAVHIRAVENFIFEKLKNKEISIPVYLSAGQEYCAVAVAYFFRNLNVSDRNIFIQHRNHHTYLAFGGSLEKLFLELLGSKDGLVKGMGGSASINCKKQGIFGHDGLMGSQAPIAVGFAFASEKMTICYAGDAAAEEDYYLAALGWAATKKLPILFIVEDNNLSIMTEVSVRRSWKISEVAKSFGLKVFDINDDPKEILSSLNSIKKYPALMNIRTNRLYWHAGAGIDDPNIFDRHKSVCESFNTEFLRELEEQSINEINNIWNKCKNH